MNTIKNRHKKFRFVNMALFSLLGMSVLPCPLFAAGGTTAFTILELAEGARPASMGEAYTALADDVYAIFYNPAGLGSICRQEISTTYLSYVADISAGSLSCVVPAFGGSVGIGAIYLNYGQLADDTAETPTGAGMAFYWPWDLVGLLSYGFRINHGLRAGMTVKGMYENIRGYSAQGVAVDVGALAEFNTFFPCSAGLTLKNAGIQTKAFLDEKRRLPLAVNLGLGCKLFSGTLALAADAVFQPDNADVNFNLGGEYNWQDFICLRTGYQTAKQELKSGASSDPMTGFGFGLGIHWDGYEFDYAFVPFNNLGNVHRVSLSLKWGEAGIKSHQPPIVESKPAGIAGSRRGRAETDKNQPGQYDKTKPAQTRVEKSPTKQQVLTDKTKSEKSKQRVNKQKKSKQKKNKAKNKRRNKTNH